MLALSQNSVTHQFSMRVHQLATLWATAAEEANTKFKLIKTGLELMPLGCLGVATTSRVPMRSRPFVVNW